MASVDELRRYYKATLPYYDLSLEHRGDLPFWESMARRWGSKRILELGCGTGRVTSTLSASAWTTAVDLLIEMLERARQRAPGARFVAADLRGFSFTSKFDLVIMADDPMAHLTSSAERMRVLERIADHLQPEGRLVLEGLYRSPESAALTPPRPVLHDGELLFTVVESWQPAQEPELWSAKYRYESAPRSRPEACTTLPAVTQVATVLRAWSPEEVRRLPEAGLQVEALWGDFDERPFAQCSSRMVIVAQRSRE